MPGSTQYECGDCRHRFNAPEGAVRDTRLMMCPACGSIDLNILGPPRPAVVVWTSGEGVPSREWAEADEKIAS